MPKGPFLPSEFTATQWSTQQEKADFANSLLNFIDSGFKHCVEHAIMRNAKVNAGLGTSVGSNHSA